MSVVFLGLSAFRFYQVIVTAYTGGSVNGDTGGGFWSTTFWFALHLALPLHLTFVALLLQRKYLKPGLGRFAWFATVISGCWLGISFVIRRLL